MRIGRLRISIVWKPNKLTKLWVGGKLSLYIMCETDKLRKMRAKIRATYNRRQRTGVVRR